MRAVQGDAAAPGGPLRLALRERGAIAAKGVLV